MCKKGFYVSGVFLLFILFAVGCKSVSFVDYIGNSYDPTTTVDVYLSKGDIEQEYTVIGHALGFALPLGIGADLSDDKIRKDLIEEAKRKGADAIVITGTEEKKDKLDMPLGSIESGGTSTDLSIHVADITTERQMKASFLKYK